MRDDTPDTSVRETCLVGITSPGAALCAARSNPTSLKNLRQVWRVHARVEPLYRNCTLVRDQTRANSSR